MKQIYLDYNATTPISPRVVESMQPFLSGHYGNPSSSHALGRAAKEAIQDARSKLSRLLGCDSEEIIFTSGGTESNNLAIKGILMQYPPGQAHLIISAIEHPAVTSPAEFLRRLGYGVTVVGCSSNGIVDPMEVGNAIESNTKLVSIMHANNEIGTIQPIREIAQICHQRGVLVHTDASQSVGKIPTSVDALEVDMLTVAGHKLYAPKGVGALYVQQGLGLEPLLHGASHENGLRAGTENTPYIVGLGAAAIEAMENLDQATVKLEEKRDRLAELLLESIPDAKINGEGEDRLPNTLSISFPETRGQKMLARSPELCASTGSACHSSGKTESVTLSAMGRDADHIAGTIRLSLGWLTTDEDVDRAASLLIDAWETRTVHA
ncbi:MAG: cysteine desulfurase family protein [Planctomycetota bacterium]